MFVHETRLINIYIYKYIYFKPDCKPPKQKTIDTQNAINQLLEYVHHNLLLFFFIFTSSQS